MVDVETVPRGIFALPNEILLSIFNLFSTRDLLPLTPTCRQIHALILRLVHNRLQIATSLDGHTLYLECYPPSSRLTDSKLFCKAIGTDGLDEILTDIHSDSIHVGKIERLGRLYSRFRPECKEADIRSVAGNRAGDIPGSRTWRAANASTARDPNNVVERIVTVDANDLFSQLSTFAYLGKREQTRGLLCSIQDLNEGTIRVWRDWLSKQCESRRWSSGDTVVVHRSGDDGPASKGKNRSDSDTGMSDPKKDPSILWINTKGENVGIKFRVKERKLRRTNMPILFENDVEVPVSYLVEFEEVLVKTTHLLLKLEEAQTLLHSHSGKAIVFGTYRGY